MLTISVTSNHKQYFFTTQIKLFFLVTVKAAPIREGKEKPFVALELTGDIKLVYKQNTGNFKP
jgi:hypothetical protein